MDTPLFLIPIVVGLFTQLLKRFFNKNWQSVVRMHQYTLPRYGGMPSAHTSFAFSLATIIFLTDGVYSSSFAIAIALIFFILDDALRMRVYLSGHGQSLEKLIGKLPSEEQKQFPPLETRLGHTLAEVLVGALVGIMCTVVLHQIIFG